MALRWKAYAPNTILKSVEVQDLADNGVVQLDTAADLASADLVNANVTYVVAEAKPYVRIAAGVGADKWQVFSGGLTGLGGWADVTATTGSPTKNEYTDADGQDWTAYQFTGDGNVTLTDGLADILVVGGAAAGSDGGGPGGGGGGGMVEHGLRMFAAGVQPVTVGPIMTTLGASDSVLGPYKAVGAFPWGHPGACGCGPGVSGYGGGGAGGLGQANTGGPGVHSSITGTDVEYGRGGNATGGATGPANTGTGGSGAGSQGTAGIVVIRVPRANAKA